MGSDLTMGGHMSPHAAVGCKCHVAHATAKVLIVAVCTNVGLEHTAGDERFQALDAPIGLLTCNLTYQISLR